MESNKPIPFDVRCLIYSYLDLSALIHKVSKFSKEDHLGICKSKILDQKRVLLLILDHEDMVFTQLQYCINLATKIDLRVQKFEQKDVFTLSTILGLCLQSQKKIELNIWVDKDLDVKTFVSAFKPSLYDKLIDFIYYRFDFGNFSFKLKGLMQAFKNVKSVHIFS